MKTFSYKVPLMVMREGKRFIAFSPALDLSTSGKSRKEAERRFDEAADIFFEEVIEHGMLDEVLRGLGWQRSRANWSAPQFISHETKSIRVPA